MPRIPPSTFRRAHQLSHHAATLLPVCRDVATAANELRWIREHAQALCPSPAAAEQHVASLCRRRGKGEPLQYVLGTQPFGILEMKCRRGVLIPRPEPEAYTTHLATLIRHHSLLGAGPPSTTTTTTHPLRVLDLCTGTGCIALLLYALLQPAIPNLCVRGIDISPHAVRLAWENARHNNLLHGVDDLKASPAPPPAPHEQQRQQQRRQQSPLAFARGDVFSPALLDDLAAGDDTSLSSSSDPSSSSSSSWDILTCNPPYVSRRGFALQTARSVRHHEPALAQAPHAAPVAYPYPYRSGDGGWREEDVFYARLLDVAARLRPRVMLFEVGDLDQALRVVAMALRHEGLAAAAAGSTAEVEVEVWRDWPDVAPEEDEETSVKLSVGEGDGQRNIRVRGSGHGRSVFIRCR